MQVVQSIKASCEMHSGELMLVVRQNGRLCFCHIVELIASCGLWLIMQPLFDF